MAKGQGLISEEPAVQMPETDVPEADLIEEKKMARYSKTDEFKRIEQYAEGRIEFYQSQLPNGESISTKDPLELGQQWSVANTIIQEFKLLIGSYKRAEEIVNESPRRKNT